MVNVCLHVLILLALFCQPLLAQDQAAAEKAYVLVRKIQGTETLPPALARELQKVSLQVVLKQPGLETILSGTDTPKGTILDLLAVEAEVLRVGDTFRIEARLINIKSKKLLYRAARDQIREEDLARLFQGAMEAIFMQYQSESDKEGPANSSNNTNGNRQNKPPGETTPNSGGGESDPKGKDKNPTVPPKKVPNTTTLNQPDPPTIDFKKRINDMQSGVDKQIAKVNESKKADATKKAADQSQINSTALNVNQMNADAPEEKPYPAKVYERIHRISIGFESRSIRSEGLVETTSNATATNLKATGHIPTSLFDGKTAYTYEAVYSFIQSDVETPSIYQLGLYGSWLSKKWSLSAGLFRDSSFFVNLADPGEGLIPNSMTSTWSRIKFESTLPFKKPWNFTASYGRPFSAQTNYEPVAAAKKWSGSHLQFEVSPHYRILTCEINLMLESINLSTQGENPLVFNEQRIGLSLRRSL